MIPFIQKTSGVTGKNLLLEAAFKRNWLHKFSLGSIFVWFQYSKDFTRHAGVWSL